MLQYCLLRNVSRGKSDDSRYRRRLENSQRNDIPDLEKREKLGLSEEDCVNLTKAFDLREESDYGILQERQPELSSKTRDISLRRLKNF